MGQRIDQFCEDLRQKLSMTDGGLEGLRTKINAKAKHVEQDVQSHLDRARERIEQGRAKVTAAQTGMKNWAEERKAITREKVAEWKEKRDLGKLLHRADNAERYAAAAIDVAVAAMDEAEQASLEAWLAREDANVAGVKHSAAG